MARTVAEDINQPFTEYDELLEGIRISAGVAKPTLRDGPEDVAMPGGAILIIYITHYIISIINVT